MADFDVDAWSEAAQQAISAVVSETDGSMVTRYVLIAEVIGADGERAMLMATSPEQRAWDTLGMLRYGDHLEAAALVADQMDGDE